MIDVQNLTKIYGRKKETLKAVDKINFHVEKGDIFGFLGPNGAGKTTTIKMLTTIILPTVGTARVCGYDIKKEAINVKKRIGLMTEQPGFYNNMKATDLLNFYASFYNFSILKRKRRVKEVIEIVGLKEYANKKVKIFSWGMRKRLALAQALLNDPELLILDEPTGGFDPASTKAFRELIKKLNKDGKTIFISSHLLPEIRQLCNKVGIIKNGKIIAVDSIKRLSDETFSQINIIVQGEGMSHTIMEIIRSLKSVTHIKYSRKKAIITVKNENISPEINSLLVANGVKVKSFRVIKPTLENIFLSLIGENGEES